MRSVITFFFSAILVCSAAAETVHYEGAITYQGDDLAIRLTIHDNDEATLDIPQLWYAGEDVAVTAEGDDFIVEFPFGLGAHNFTRQGDAWVSDHETFAARLTAGTPPPYSQIDLATERGGAVTEGTLFLPEGEGPHPAVIIVGGSSSANRTQWSYRSKADYFAQQGIAAYVYDRRAYDNVFADGAAPDFWTHAADLAAIRDMLGARDDIDGDTIGLMGGSQGVWISTIAQADHGGFAFLIFTGVPAVSPGEQDIQMLMAGLRDDGVSEDEIADAVAYRRLYFSVAHSLEGLDELQESFERGNGSTWIDYVDVPETLDGLSWWHRHQAYAPREDLLEIDIPILAMTGSRDWVTPPYENLPLLDDIAVRSGSENIVTMIIDGADHRLERSPYTDADGQWQWFEIAQEARDAIPAFLRDEVGLTLTN